MLCTALSRDPCSENLNPLANSQASELGSRSVSLSSVFSDCGPTLQLHYSLMRDPKPEPPAKPLPSETIFAV